MNFLNPLIIQSDMDILLEVENPLYSEARDAIAPFTELVKSPEHIHTYRVTPLSLWNAASVGLKPSDVLERCTQYAKYPVPPTVTREINNQMGRYGRLKLSRYEDDLLLEGDEAMFWREVIHIKGVDLLLGKQISEFGCRVHPKNRGILKQLLTNAGFPVEDLAGYTEGDPLTVNLRQNRLENGDPLNLRHYQVAASQIFYASGAEKGGSGVVVLPCGAGKTVVGIASMALVKAKTLILTPNIVAGRQWIREILDKTELKESQVKEYSGERKEIGDVTVATYQILTQKSEKDGPFLHFDLFMQHKWGLMIYDEVHLLPAPVFRACAEMQATRRLGLTATLVREDGRETEVFSLIGPKKFDLPWKKLEEEGWIAKAVCHELRIDLSLNERMDYAVADPREKIRIASTSAMKDLIAEELIYMHQAENDRILIIGQYIEQLDRLTTHLNIPLVTGKTPNRKREELFGAFRSGEIKHLIVSKVGNFAIDLPDANVLIQVSGTFGSRQEEAQRLGRVLRPKKDGGQAYFYTLVTQDTKEQEFAMNRQLFLTEQGYEYKILQAIPGQPIDVGPHSLQAIAAQEAKDTAQ
jgi:DNA excision repair protein ERCC-3